MSKPPIRCGRVVGFGRHRARRGRRAQSALGAMLVERLAADTVGIALHHERPVGEDRQQVRRRAHVVAEEIAFCEF